MTATLTDQTMNGKPVYAVPAKSVLNMKSGFKHKLLCDGPTFTAGSACAYSCSFCYVSDLMKKSPHLAGVSERHEDIVIRRENAIEALRQQLTVRGKPRFPDPNDNRVCYASPLVDVAANVTLRDETIDAVRVIMELTHWHVRLLSKSNLLPSIAQALHEHRDRIIYGVSTGTLDDNLAKGFEIGTALVSKRIASLHWLQDNGYRTFGMICPSLPQADYASWARGMYEALRADRCEHVWAEIMNVRGESMTRTVDALRGAGYDDDAERLRIVSTDADAWERYSCETFLAHAPLYRPGQLRFLQYVTAKTKGWWEEEVNNGAILL
jgi:DNA repair photolyase